MPALHIHRNKIRNSISSYRLPNKENNGRCVMCVSACIFMYVHIYTWIFSANKGNSSIFNYTNRVWHYAMWNIPDTWIKKLHDVIQETKEINLKYFHKKSRMLPDRDWDFTQCIFKA